MVLVAGGWGERVRALILRLFLIGMLILIVVAIPANDPAGRRDWRAFQAAEGNTLDLFDRQLELLFRPQVAVGGDPTDLELLVRYFDAARTVGELRRDAIRRAALGEPRSSNQAALEEAVGEEASIRPAAMETLRQIVERELVSAGFDQRGLHLDVGLGYLHVGLRPPVNFQIGQLPQVLLVAPRDSIRLDTSLLLGGGLDVETIQIIEEQFESEEREYVALVENIGGIALFPPLISPRKDLGSAVFTIAHEWTHHYLLIHPLGREYFFSDEARSINETAADIVGDEVRASALARLGPAAKDAGASSGDGATEFDTLLRETRETVQTFLDGGEVERAETYMEARQRELADLGYPIRRLNTAYLAWHGGYAGTGNRYEAPLRKLRGDSANLRDFLDRTKDITTYDRLVEAVKS